MAVGFGAIMGVVLMIVGAIATALISGGDVDNFFMVISVPILVCGVVCVVLFSVEFFRTPKVLIELHGDYIIMYPNRHNKVEIPLNQIAKVTKHIMLINSRGGTPYGKIAVHTHSGKTVVRWAASYRAVHKQLGAMVGE